MTIPPGRRAAQPGLHGGGPGLRLRRLHPYPGGYTLSGEGIAFAQMAATMMACAPAVAEQEGRFLRALGKAKR